MLMMAIPSSNYPGHNQNLGPGFENSPKQWREMAKPIHCMYSEVRQPPTPTPRPSEVTPNTEHALSARSGLYFLYLH